MRLAGTLRPEPPCRGRWLRRGASRLLGRCDASAALRGRATAPGSRPSTSCGELVDATREPWEPGEDGVEPTMAESTSA